MQREHELITPRDAPIGAYNYNRPPALRRKARCVPPVPSFSSRNETLLRETLTTPRDLPVADRAPPQLKRKERYQPCSRPGVSIYSEEGLGRESLITPRESSGALKSILPPQMNRKNQSRARISAGSILGEPLSAHESYCPPRRSRSVLFDDDKENDTRSGKHCPEKESTRVISGREATFVNQQHLSGHRVEVSVFEHSGGLSIIAVAQEKPEDDSISGGKYALRIGQAEIDAIKPLADMDTLEKVVFCENVCRTLQLVENPVCQKLKLVARFEDLASGPHRKKARKESFGSSRQGHIIHNNPTINDVDADLFAQQLEIISPIPGAKRGKRKRRTPSSRAASEELRVKERRHARRKSQFRSTREHEKIARERERADHARAAQEVAADSRTVPKEFRCAISHRCMADPVKAKKSGCAFDRVNIEHWLEEQGSVCPITHSVLTNEDLLPQPALKEKILKWKLQSDAGENTGQSSVHVTEESLYDF